MCEKKLLFFVLFLVASFLFAESDTASTGKSPMSNLARQSRLRTDQYFRENSQPSQPNLSESERNLLNPNNPWDDLRKLIDEGMQGLSESNEALTQLEQQLGTLRAETQEQRRLLEESRNLVISLKQSLAEAQNSVDIAIDRMQDAEDYAFWIDAQNELLRQQVQQYRTSAMIGFSFGGISFGVGVPLAVEGIRSDNRAMLWSGVGVIGVGSLVWVVGHFVFNWW